MVQINQGKPKGDLFPSGEGKQPLLRGAVLLGAIGVSGAKSEEDEVIAQAGIDTL